MKIMAAMVFAASYATAIAADCYSCAMGSFVCTGAGVGKCDWEGGSLCTGGMDCAEPWPMQNPLPECNEDDDGNMTSCTVGRRTDPTMTAGCKVRCKVVPFLSCSCQTTGAFGGSASGFHAPYLECKKQ